MSTKEVNHKRKRHQRATTDYLSAMPDALLNIIFSYLDIKTTRYCLAPVNHRLLEIAFSSLASVIYSNATNTWHIDPNTLPPPSDEELSDNDETTETCSCKAKEGEEFHEAVSCPREGCEGVVCNANAKINGKYPRCSECRDIVCAYPFCKWNGHIGFESDEYGLTEYTAHLLRREGNKDSEKEDYDHFHRRGRCNQEEGGGGCELCDEENFAGLADGDDWIDDFLDFPPPGARCQNCNRVICDGCIFEPSGKPNDKPLCDECADSLFFINQGGVCGGGCENRKNASVPAWRCCCCDKFHCIDCAHYVELSWCMQCGEVHGEVGDRGNIGVTQFGYSCMWNDQHCSYGSYTLCRACWVGIVYYPPTVTQEQARISGIPFYGRQMMYEALEEMEEMEEMEIEEMEHFLSADEVPESTAVEEAVEEVLEKAASGTAEEV